MVALPDVAGVCESNADGTQKSSFTLRPTSVIEASIVLRSPVLHQQDPKWRDKYNPQILKRNIANAEPGTCSTQGKRTCPFWSHNSFSAYGLTR